MMPSAFNRHCAFLLAGALSMSLAHAEPSTSGKNKSLDQLEQRLDSIDSELSELAELTLRSDVGNQGWQSRPHDTPQHTEWLRIDLGETQRFDRVVLVPVLWRHSEMGVQADGFPVHFEVIAGEHGKGKGRTIASAIEADPVLPRIAPLVIDVEPTKADWIRIKASTLSQRAIDKKYSMRLSEVFVFDGEQNIALNKKAKFSSIQGTIVKTTHPSKAIVDGFTPYVMNAARGKKSPAFVAFFLNTVQPSILIDLGEPYQLDHIHLHAVDIQETVPHLQHGDYALPKHMIAEGANRADFSDATPLADFQRESIYGAAPIIPIKLNAPAPFRYLRLRMIDSYKAPEAGDAFRCVGFAEIEVLANNRNIALGKTFEITGEFTRTHGQIHALSDGHNHFGEILPMRQWLEQLARRHELETERPIILKHIKFKYAKQQRNLTIFQWSLGILAVGTVIIILIERNKRKQAIIKTRERIAANLHDELGANLNAIGILGDLAKDEVGANENLSDIVGRIRTLSNRTSSAVRYCTNMLARYPMCNDVAEEMQRSSQRLLADIDHQFSTSNQEILNQLAPRQRLDLLLFYQECLSNIVQHAEATWVRTHLSASKHEVELTVEDNGIGTVGEAPKSLKRRAKLLKGRVESTPLKSGGTRIHLKLKSKKRFFK